MDGRGRALDNVFIERLWRSVKYENVFLHSYDSGKSLHEGLNKYFHFYNNQRPHQNLNYQAPEQVYQNHKELEKPISNITIADYFI